MPRSGLLGILVTLSVLAVPACGDSGGLATAPTPISELPLVSGSITLTSATPASGSAVEVRACDPDLSLDRPGTGYVVLCNQQLRLIFDVVIDRGLSDAYLAVEFMTDRGPCGFGSTPTIPLMAGHTSLMSDFIVVSADPNAPVPCALPASTTRVVASLRTRASGDRVLLTREFDQVYTVVMR